LLLLFKNIIIIII